MNERKKLFGCGQIVATPGALERLNHFEITAALTRHLSGDWGDCCPDDAAANDRALENGARIFSVYHSADGVKFWVITEATGDDGSRASTCILLPGEY